MLPALNHGRHCLFKLSAIFGLLGVGLLQNAFGLQKAILFCGVLFVIAFVVMLAAVLGFLFFDKRNVKKILFSFALICLLSVVVFAYFGWQQQRWLNNNKEAIVFQPSITVTSTPDNAGEELFVLHEGTKVRIVERFRDWIRIRIGDGNVGWVPEKVVEEI